MQTVKMDHEVMSGKGWTKRHCEFTCDEGAGLAAGSDIYAAARGTAIKIMRHFGLFGSCTAYLTVDDGARIQIHYSTSDSRFHKHHYVDGYGWVELGGIASCQPQAN